MNTNINMCLRQAGLTLMGLMMGWGMTSCSDNEDVQTMPQAKMRLSVGIADRSRAMVTASTLADGSQVGVLLVDDGGSTYDGTTYSNVVFTASGTGTSQSWSGADVLLSATDGTLYGYYPYSSAVTNITAVPVESASQTDYMYATPVTGVNMQDNEPALVMNHALGGLRLTIDKGTYTGTGALTTVAYSSDGIATSATLNAKTGALSGITGAGTENSSTVSLTLSSTAQSLDYIVVPAGTSATITFNLTVDGKLFSATSEAVTLTQGNIYEYTISLVQP